MNCLRRVAKRFDLRSSALFTAHSHVPLQMQLHARRTNQPQKLSKIETLRLAHNYILALTQILAEGHPMEDTRLLYVLSRGLSQATTNLLASSLGLQAPSAVSMVNTEYEDYMYAAESWRKPGGKSAHKMCQNNQYRMDERGLLNAESTFHQDKNKKTSTHCACKLRISSPSSSFSSEYCYSQSGHALITNITCLWEDSNDNFNSSEGIYEKMYY